MSTTFSRYLVAGLAALCFALLGNSLVAYYNISRLIHTEREINHTLEVREVLEQLLAAIIETEAAARGFAATAAPEHMQAFDNAVRRIPVLQQSLRTLTSGNPLQQRNLDVLQDKAERKLTWVQALVETRRTEGSDAALAQINSGQGTHMMEQVRAAYQNVHGEEDRLLDAHSDEASASLTITVATLAAFSAGSVLLSILGFHFLRREMAASRRADESIRENERQYRRLFSEHPHPMFIYDLETLRFLEVNESALQKYGYTREEFLALTVKDIRPPEDVPRFLEALAVMSGSFNKAGDWRHRKKDGSDFDVQITVQEIMMDGRRAKMALINDVTDRKRADEALHHANQMLRLVLDHVPQHVFWKDANLRFLGCNRRFAMVTGLAHPDELIGKDDRDMSWHAGAEALRADDRAVLETGTPKLNYEEQVKRADGSSAWVRTSKVPLRDLEGKAVGILGTFEDITKIKEAEQRLRLQASAMESSINGILIVNATLNNYPIEYVNPAFVTMMGYASDKLVGRSAGFLLNDDMRQEDVREIRAAFAEQRACQVTLRYYRQDGSAFWADIHVGPVRDEHGSVTHYVGILNDITERTRYLEQLERQANFDELTGLPNRNLLRERIAQAIAQGERHGHGFGVMVIDLDNFQFLNDSIGHAFGDALIDVIAKRLQSLARDEDTVARVGEDGFVLLLAEQDDADAIALAVNRVLVHVAEPISLQGREVRITCSVGIGMYPQDGSDTETLIRHADIAMYRAKEAGGNNFQIFRSDMTQRISDRIVLENGMHQALAWNEFMLHYQPQVDLRSGRIVGAEALIRWNHPEQGMISPARFMPLAEDSDLILTIGEWVLRTACRQAKAWQDAGLHHLVMSVNVSVRQFQQEDFADRVLRVLRETGLDARYLELELTESVLMTHVEELIEVLDRLKAAGIHLAVDDFGTGYSSLNYLKRLPVDKLKIDQSFVRDIPEAQDDMAIARAIIALSRSLELTVIAEGVETKEQLDFLRANDCDQIQGYYFSRPVDADAFAQILAENRTLQ